MRRSTFAIFTALLGSVSLLAGCCANNTCDCQDELADAITLRFKTPVGADSTGYSLEELDTIRVVRTRLPSASTTFRSDTVVITRPTALAGDSISIGNTTPFAISGTLRINAYTYAVLIPQNNRKKPKEYQHYELNTIRLRGGYQPDGCCTCYENTEKSATLSFVSKGKSDAISTNYDLKAVREIVLTRK